MDQLIAAAMEEDASGEHMMGTADSDEDNNNNEFSRQFNQNDGLRDQGALEQYSSLSNNNYARNNHPHALPAAVMSRGVSSTASNNNGGTITWQSMFQQLQDFHELGHRRVPPRLSKWMNSQRRQYKLYGVGIKQPVGIMKNRIRQLNSIGFEWNVVAALGDNTTTQEVLTFKGTPANPRVILPPEHRRGMMMRGRMSPQKKSSKRSIPSSSSNYYVTMDADDQAMLRNIHRRGYAKGKRWTEDEDEMITRFQGMWGNKWSKMAKQFNNGRSDKDFQNRWRSLKGASRQRGMQMGTTTSCPQMMMGDEFEDDLEQSEDEYEPGDHVQSLVRAALAKERRGGREARSASGLSQSRYRKPSRRSAESYNPLGEDDSIEYNSEGEDIVNFRHDRSTNKPTIRTLSGNRTYFPEILHDMVTDCSANEPHVVDWIPDGTAFQIKDMALLPTVIGRYFRHNNYKSLNRMMYMYGFHKIPKGPYAGAHKHPYFTRDSTREDLILRVRKSGEAESSRESSAKDQARGKKELPVSKSKRTKHPRPGEGRFGLGFGGKPRHVLFTSKPSKPAPRKTAKTVPVGGVSHPSLLFATKVPSTSSETTSTKPKAGSEAVASQNDVQMDEQKPAAKPEPDASPSKAPRPEEELAASSTEAPEYPNWNLGKHSDSSDVQYFRSEIGEKWVEQVVPRKTVRPGGPAIDRYWLSPDGHRFRSMTEVQRFLDVAIPMKQDDNEDMEGSEGEYEGQDKAAASYGDWEEEGGNSEDEELKHKHLEEFGSNSDEYDEGDDAAERARFANSGFVPSLHALVSYVDREEPTVMSWGEDGDEFIIHNMEKEVLGHYIQMFFKHNKPPSLMKQLGNYGFTKGPTESGRSFRHPYFHQSMEVKSVSISAPSKRKRAVESEDDDRPRKKQAASYTKQMSETSQASVTFQCPHCSKEFHFGNTRTAKASFSNHLRKCGPKDEVNKGKDKAQTSKPKARQLPGKGKLKHEKPKKSMSPEKVQTKDTLAKKQKSATTDDQGVTLHCRHCNKDFHYAFAQTAAASFAHHTKACDPNKVKVEASKPKKSPSKGGKTKKSAASSASSAGNQTELKKKPASTLSKTSSDITAKPAPTLKKANSPASTTTASKAAPKKSSTPVTPTDNDIILSLKNPKYKEVMFTKFEGLGKRPGSEENPRLDIIKHELFSLFKKNLGEHGRFLKSDRRMVEMWEIDDEEALEKIKMDLRRRNESIKHWLVYQALA